MRRKSNEVRGNIILDDVNRNRKLNENEMNRNRKS